MSSNSQKQDFPGDKQHSISSTTSLWWENLSTRIGAVCSTSLYPQFNGSHFSQPPSSISTKWLHCVAKTCERWRMRTCLICGKQMREQQGCLNEKEKKMDLVSSLLYNCLSSNSSWGVTVGLTQNFWRKWLLGPLDKLVKTVWEKIIHEVGVKRPSKLLHCTRFLYKLVQCTCNWSFLDLCVRFYNRHFA